MGLQKEGNSRLLCVKRNSELSNPPLKAEINRTNEGIGPSAARRSFFLLGNWRFLVGCWMLKKTVTGGNVGRRLRATITLDEESAGIPTENRRELELRMQIPVPPTNY